MTTQELRELDAWIAENVMNLTLWKETAERYTAILNPNEYVLSIPGKIVRARIGFRPTDNFEPTTDPAAAMEVLRKCSTLTSYAISNGTTGFMISDLDKKSRYGIGETL